MKKITTKSIWIIIATVLLGIVAFPYLNKEKNKNLDPWQKAIRAEIGDPAYTEVDPNDIYADKILVEIANRQFMIPKAYIDTPGTRNKIKDSVVLEYILPDYESKLEYKNLPNYREEIILKGRYAGVLLEESAIRPSFDDMIAMHLKTKPYGIGEVVDSSLYGLVKHSVNIQKAGLDRKPDDRFIEYAADGSIKSFLRCSPEGKDINPGCGHKFRDNGILYDAHWSIRDLPNWQKQRDEIIEFVEQFEITQSEEEE